MNDTPRTDDEVFIGTLQTEQSAYVGEYVSASLARQLERELAEAIRLLRRCSSAAYDWQKGRRDASEWLYKNFPIAAPQGIGKEVSQPQEGSAVSQLSVEGPDSQLRPAVAAPLGQAND